MSARKKGKKVNQDENNKHDTSLQTTYLQNTILVILLYQSFVKKELCLEVQH